MDKFEESLSARFLDQLNYAELESDFENSTSNYSQWNFTVEEWNYFIRQKEKSLQNVSAVTETVLIVLYIILIVSGLVANLLVSFVVAKRRQMHTARNLYIVNLTVSDISLCVICMPFTLVMILRRQWTLGPILCKLVHALQGTNIMVSVGTITVIALDRYLTICKKTTEDRANTKKRVVTSIVIIWMLSLIASMPLFFFQGLESVTFNDFVLYEACIEQWPSQEVRVLYDSGVLLIMAVLPPVAISIVHGRIASYLSAHARTQRDTSRAKREMDRNRRTTLLLSGIVIIFVTSWLPLGIFSLLADFVFTYDTSSDNVASPNQMYTAFAIVHLCAMTSAVSNPVVYGWMNSNIRREFFALLPSACLKFAKPSEKNDLNVNEMETMRTQLNTGAERKESLAVFISSSKNINVETYTNL